MLFVDTSALYAAIDQNDKHNERAHAVLLGETLLTTDHVLVETWLLVARRLGHSRADEFWHGVRTGGVSMQAAVTADLEAAWAIGERFPDQGFSLVDRTSFAVMERLGVTRVAAFDHHFAVYRYGRNRERAFEIVR